MAITASGDFAEENCLRSAEVACLPEVQSQ